MRRFFRFLVFAITAGPPLLGAAPNHSVTADEIEGVIKHVFRAITDHEVESLRALLDDQLLIIEGGEESALTKILNSQADILQIFRHDRNWTDLELREFDVLVLDAIPSLAIASFTLILPLTPEQIAESRKALQQVENDDHVTRQSLENEIRDRVLRVRGTAMFARRLGRWKMIVLALPR